MGGFSEDSLLAGGALSAVGALVLKIRRWTSWSLTWISNNFGSLGGLFHVKHHVITGEPQRFSQLFAISSGFSGSKHALAHREYYQHREGIGFGGALTSYSVPPEPETESAEASVESTTARLCFFMTDCTLVIPKTLRSLSSGTFIGPG